MRLLLKIWMGLGVLILLVVFGGVAWDLTTYSKDDWRADYETLKHEMAQGYANLDWMIEKRGMDLKALDEKTSRAIDKSHMRMEAIAAFESFIRAFHDPHLKITDNDGENEIRVSIGTSVDKEIDREISREIDRKIKMKIDRKLGREEANEETSESCRDAGYDDTRYGFRFPFDDMDGWKDFRDGPFATGMIGDVGVLRIAAFGEDQYIEACRSVWKTGMSKPELKLAVRALLQDELTEAIAELKQEGAKRLLVDITGNGGGTEWVTDVVALLTDKELTRQPSRLAAPACDRSGIWRNEKVCPVLGPPGEPIKLQGSGAWTGPLFILADNETGSASEDFIAWLQQNGVAKAIGEKTAGAGCGYVDGGGRIRLRHTPFDVRAPNCARFLNDGTNEIEGLKPDIALDLDMDDDEKIAALARALKP